MRAFSDLHGDDYEILFVVRGGSDAAAKTLDVITCDESPDPQPGETVIALVRPPKENGEAKGDMTA